MLFCLGDVPATNIFNYDETNLQDDPGHNWLFVRRGRKRVENVKDTSKTSIAVMWCGSAARECLPPMVVYKAKMVVYGILLFKKSVESNTRRMEEGSTNGRVV